MKSWFTILMVMGLCAGCGPSDQHVQSVRDRVMAGEYVEFTENGKSFCGPFVVWSDIRVDSKDERQRIIVGKQKSYVQPTWSTCYRVGDTVALRVNKDDVASAGGGLLKVKAIGFVLLDKLYGKAAEGLKGSYFKSVDNLNQYKGSKRPFPDAEGVVTVVTFEYLAGTAADEAAVKKADREESETPAYKEQIENDKTLSTCKDKVWTDFPVKPEFLDAIKSGELRSTYNTSNQNCVKIGSEIGLRTGSKPGDPAQVKVRVLKTKSFRTRFASIDYFDLHGYKWEDLKAILDAEKPSEFLTVVDFEFVSEVSQ